MIDNTQPLELPELEALARKVVRRLPGCPEPDCHACRNNLAFARDVIRRASLVGVRTSASELATGLNDIAGDIDAELSR